MSDVCVLADLESVDQGSLEKEFSHTHHHITDIDFPKYNTNTSSLR